MPKWPKIIKFILIATLILPLIYTQWTIYPSHFGKTVFFQMIVAVLAVGGYYWLFLRRREFVKLQLLDWLIMAFVASSLLSSVLGIEWNRSFWGDQSRAQGVFTLLHFVAFYFLLRQFFRSREDWHRVGAVILAVSAVSSVIAWIGPVAPLLRSYVPSGRLQGLIANPIFFANYLLVPVFLGGFCFFYFRGRKRRWWFLAATILAAAALVGSQTRGPFIGLIVGLAAIGVLYFIFLANKRARIVSLALTAIVAAAIFLGFIQPKVAASFPTGLQFIFTISSATSTAQTRLMAWQIALKGWRERPIFGAGPESFQDIFDHHYNPKFLRFSFAETVWDQPHNYALEILSSRGLVGLGIYLAIIISALIALWRVIRGADDRRHRLAAVFLIGAIIGYPAALLFSFETSNSWQLWFVLLALIAWLRFQMPTKASPRLWSGVGPPLRDGMISLAGRHILRKTGFVILIFLGISSIYYNYQMLKSSYYTSYARDAALLQSTYLWQGYAERAISIPAPFQWEQAFFLTKDMAILDGYQKLDAEALAAVAPKIEQVFLSYLVKKPDTYLYKFWLSQLYAFMGEFVDKAYYPKAEKLLRETWAINKGRQTVPLLLSKTYFIEGKAQESINVLRELVSQDPVLEQPHWFLGLNLVRAGRLEEGIAELEAGKGYGLSPKNNIIYFIDVYAQAKQYKKIPPLYEMLIVQEPDNYSYYASLAATYAALGEKEHALQNIKKAVELNPALSAEAEQFIKDNGLRNK